MQTTIDAPPGIGTESDGQIWNGRKWVNADAFRLGKLGGTKNSKDQIAARNRNIQGVRSPGRPKGSKNKPKDFAK